MARGTGSVNEAPKSRTLLAVINSAAFFLACVRYFLSAGGWYFTAYQECARQSEKVVETLQSTSRQYTTAISLDIARDASKVEEVTKQIQTGGNLEALNKESCPDQSRPRSRFGQMMAAEHEKQSKCISAPRSRSYSSTSTDISNLSRHICSTRA